MNANFTPEYENTNNYKYKLIPFRFFCYDNFPFIEETFDGLTTYQLLQKIVKYLNEVITNQNIVQDNMNIQNENIKKLYEAYNELQNYVNNYFDNLDIQEEINNKLDQMAEDGTLQEIITQFLKLKALLVYDNVEEMKNSINLVEGSYVYTLGYHTKGDFGQAHYKIRTKIDSDIVNEMNLISINNTNLVAELIIPSTITPEMFGAFGDGENDDTLSLTTAMNTGLKIICNKSYKADFGGTLYDGGTDITNNINIEGGIFNLNGRLNFSKNLLLNNVSINGNVWFTGKNYIGDIVSIRNSKFNVGELTFRLNNVDFKNVYIENNYINFYGAFWSSSQADSGSKSEGNVFIKNNEFFGKTVDSQTESYYCACVVENQFVEFSGNYCHDFIINKNDTYSIHDGYFSCENSYVHDNKCINFSGGNNSSNALLKAKNYGKRFFNNNYYEMSSENTQFPIFQVEDANSEWHVDNCSFIINNCTTTSIASSEKIFINNCNFEITNLNDLIMKNSFNMNNCKININTMNTQNILSLNHGKISNTEINVVNTPTEETYGAIYGYTYTDNELDNIKCNIYLIKGKFIGRIKNCNIYVDTTAVVGELINCTINSRYFLFYDSSTGYNFDINIIQNGKLFGHSFASTETFDYTDGDSPNIRIGHNKANTRGSITIFGINDYKNKAIISLLRNN